ncbi:uncharacterized protein [Rutidosis leptorrhynchoides]|uniref:uncharacterized protein n=1 Tax=Rutidosis leptorrhynchoides TaxID=125765 RepID=UPI003A9902A2
MAEKMGIKALKVSVNSQLVLNQMNGTFEARDPAMQKYLKLAEDMANKFELFSITQVPRFMNKKADALSKLATSMFSHIAKDVWVEVLSRKSTDVVQLSTCFDNKYAIRITNLKHNEHGHVEVTNRDIVAGIRARLDTDRKEISVPTQRVLEFNDESNVINLKENLDLLEDRREIAAIREASNKRKIAKYYNQRVKERTFRPEDYVWRNNNAIRFEDIGKLGPNWEGPYVIVEALGNRAYNLKTHDGKFVPHTWHATNLKKFYA